MAGLLIMLDSSSKWNEVWKVLEVWRVYPQRCLRVATQVHHMIGGRGKRGRGISALAEHKQAVCDVCHEEITGGIGGKKLMRIGGDVPLWTDFYRGVR